MMLTSGQLPASVSHGFVGMGLSARVCRHAVSQSKRIAHNIIRIHDASILDEKVCRCATHCPQAWCFAAWLLHVAKWC